MRAELANYRTSPSLGPADRSNRLESTTSRRQAALRECAVGRVGGSSRGHRAACPGRDAASAGWLSASDNHRGGGGYYVGSSFDTIDHAALLRLVARRVSDGSILRLVKLFLKAPIVEEKTGRRTIHPNDRGTPQGGVISPLLANLYLNGMDHGVNGKPELDAKLVRYADDFVALTPPGKGEELHRRLKVYLERKGLTLNAAKTRVFDIRHQSLSFLGFTIRWQRSWRTGRSYPHVEPSQKARCKLHDSTRKILNRWTTYQSCKATVTQVNRVARGWSQYYHHGNCTRVFGAELLWLRQRMRGWLWRKYDRTLNRYSFFTDERLHGQYQLFTIPTRAPYLR